MKALRIVLMLGALSFGFGAKPALAAWDEYDDSQSHPLRVLAYLVHPAAFLVEWTVFRPLHFLVSATEAQEAIFGHTPHPPVLADPPPPRPASKPKHVSLRESAVDQTTAAATAQSLENAGMTVERP